MASGTLEDLQKVIVLQNLPEEHLKWIFERSSYEEFQDGSIIVKTGETIDDLIFISEGKVLFYMDVNGKLVYYFTFANDVETGGATGLLPYSRMKTAPGQTFASGVVKAFRLHKRYFPELEQLNPELIQRLISYMTERARTFATQKLQYEKVNALGQLAAGIAHELNNPAAAIDRISSEMSRRLTDNFLLTEKLFTAQANAGLMRSIHEQVELKKTATGKSKISAIQKIELEDEMNLWFETNCKGSKKPDSAVFIQHGFTTDDFEKIKNNSGPEVLSFALLWLENLLISQTLIKDLNDASCRISNLIGAIKSHVHMDRTNELQATDIHKDIVNTLTLLGHKLRAKNISVIKKFCSDMLPVPAYIGELNQVWTNLIDNAIFAMSPQGELIIETSCDTHDAKVRFIDNGSGIPEAIVSRIFDPFFTTKKVGEGTGIGLDLVMRIVKRHMGDIKVRSVPGRTEFTVCLPLKTQKN